MSFCTNQYFELNRNTGHIYIRSDIPEDEMRQPLTLVVRATQFDNADRYAIRVTILVGENLQLT